MISYIKGIFYGARSDCVVVETGGIGYAVHVPLSVLDKGLRPGDELTLYTYLQVREDAFALYGFLLEEDRELFRELLGVSGIGPKAALGILSVLSPAALRTAVISGDSAAICKAPGVGKKTAQRLILELKDKIDTGFIPSAPAGQEEGDVSPTASKAAVEAIEALVALGYTHAEASGAVKKVDMQDGMDSEAVLKGALKHLAFL